MFGRWGGRRMLAAAVSVAILGTLNVLAEPAHAGASFTYVQKGPLAGPSARDAHAMAYDSDRGRTVLFGGSNGTALGDTWEWDGQVWRQLTPATSPPARANHAMAYDSARRRVVMFGGSNATTQFGDTWLWDGTNWTPAAPATSPHFRIWHAMAFDAARSKVVLYGGESTATGLLGDAWLWDGTTWTQSAAPAGARRSHSMSYDAGRQEVVMFGGWGVPFGYMRETWVWNGTSWGQRFGAQPSGRASHAMAYDASRGKTVLFGGHDGSYRNDTWEWNGTSWAQVTTTASPPARGSHALVYDSARTALLTFGGSSPGYLGDTWSLAGSSWSRLGFQSPSARSGAAMAYDLTRGHTVLFGGRSATATHNDTWIWDGTGWRSLSAAVSPPARFRGALAYDSSRGKIILFGGWSGTTSLNDTWEWDGTAWTNRTPATSPPARYAHAMAYDQTRGRLVLFGGTNGTATLGDTWEWDGTSWTQPTVAVAPAARWGHSMAWFGPPGSVALFGGGTGDEASSETWSWNGTEWSRHASSPTPPGRRDHGMAFDTSRKRLVVYGGVPGTGTGTWEWDGISWKERLAGVSPPGRYQHSMAYDAARAKIVVFGGQGESALLDDTWQLDPDTVAPDTTLLTGPAGAVSSTSASFTFASDEAEVAFECSLDAAPYMPCTNPLSLTVQEGRHTLLVRAVDADANTDATPASRTWDADVTAPDTTVQGGPASLVNSSAASFELRSNEVEVSFQCSLDAAPFAPCASPASYTSLSEGAHTFRARAMDAAGNVDASEAIHRWTVDGIAPDTQITSGPIGPVASASATFSFTSTESGATLECALDGAAFQACTSPKTYSGLAQGSHSLSVRARDAAGNLDPTPASRQWTVDTVAPDTLLVTKPPAAASSTSATFEFEADEAGSTFRCSLDGGVFTSCTSPRYYTGLTQGAHTFQVRATDSAGNVDSAPAAASWTVDTVAPNTSISSGPSGTVSSATATFAFTSTETGTYFMCSLDAQAFEPCTSPAVYPELSEGSHTFRVRASDAAGNSDASPASRTWTVDTVAPETSITAAPPAGTSGTDAVFQFGVSEAGSRFECRLDGAPFAACTSPKSYSGLAEGVHLFDVRAVDAAGNTDQSPASHRWTIDTSAPQVAITRPEPGLYVLDSKVASGGTVAVVAGDITVEASAEDPGSGIGSVRFEVDGTVVDPSMVTYDASRRVYTFIYKAAGPGTHRVTARAVNGVGSSAAASAQLITT
ncbi:MAG TPA: kelch repeat-containing protein [Actinomycetota bacterium]|nr:kelch repeat-containing protein [Actinomycetota bacterium]